MLSTVRAVVRGGKIELLENVQVPDGTALLVTILPGDDEAFWLGCSQSSLDHIWNNPEDDAYVDLLKE